MDDQDENASLKFGHHHQHIFQGLISGGGTLAVLKDAAVHLNRGKLQIALALYEGSAFGLLPRTQGAIIDIPHLEVRGVDVHWNGALSMGAGKSITFYVANAATPERPMLTVCPSSQRSGGQADIRGGSQPR